jgi:multidrug resistance efflux pump
MRWLVNEGDGVTKGQAIAELADNDPNILARLGSARDATLSQSSAIASAIRVAEGQVDALIDAREAGLELAKAKVQIAREKQQEAEQKEIAAKAKRETASINLTRQRSLNEKGLLSDRNLELAELAVATASSEALQAAASLRAARRSVGAAESSLAETQQKNRASVEKARGELEKLRAEAGKITAKTAEAETKLARQEQMTILAPRDGRILSIRAREGSDFVKTGDVMAMLIPDTHNRAVELWVDGNDAPLVTQGRKVRLQFEGWPAVQFVGWPSMAVGTFGGAVSYIDPSSRANGDVRIMVVPDPESDPWPEAQYLRQGVRARGWILLNRVTVAYELWRQFNGFPPSIESAPSTNKKVGK